MYTPSSAPPIDDLVAELVAGAMAARMTKKELASRACLHPNTLRRFGTPDWNPKMTTIRALQSALPSVCHPVTDGASHPFGDDTSSDVPDKAIPDTSAA